MKALVCPVDAGHGPVLPVKDPTSRWGWHCPHQAHDGRLRSHPLGAAPQVRAMFTTAEVEAGQLLDVPASRPAPDDSTAVLGGRARGDSRTPPEAPVASTSGASPAAGVLPPISAATHLTVGRSTG